MKSKILVGSLLALITSWSAIAQPGALDDGFATNGIFRSTLGEVFSGNNSTNAVAVQNDGKIIFAGKTSYEAAIARLNPDGTLDLGFGTDGKTFSDFGFDYNRIYDIAIRPDGKIIALGNSNFYQSSMETLWLVRYNPNGTLDSSFGQGGYKVVMTGFDINRPNTLALLPDGKMVIAGSGSPFWTGFVGRYHENGEPDSSFGQGGLQMVKYGDGLNFLNAMVMQSDGKILVAGANSQNPMFNAALARLNADGTFDNTFGTNGSIITSSPDIQSVLSLAIQSDGKIVATGGSGTNTIIWRYNEDGTLDNSYGTNGLINVVAEGLKRYSPTSVLQPDGKLIIAGHTGEISTGSSDVVTLSRFTTGGSFDHEFGDDGTVMTDIDQGKPERINQVLLQPDGKILAVGFVSSQFGADFTVLRYLSGLDVGTIDFSISNNQVFIYPNPIGQTATLKYTLPHSEDISVQLFSEDGKRLYSFMENEKRYKGDHSEFLVWPAGLPSGNYVLSILSGNGKVGIKVVH